MTRWVLLVGLAACAPSVDGPVERQQATDGRDGDALASQVRALPGVVRAEVVLRRPAADPLTTAPPAPPALAIVAVVDDQANRPRTQELATQLARATAPGVEPTIVVEVGAVRPQLATVGPFTVEAGSRGRLKAVLVAAFVVIAALAAWIAARYRRGSSAQ